MKKANKTLNILGHILIVVLVFLCGFNVTYAYFTARATVEGSLQFYDLNVQFAYRKPSTAYEANLTGSNEYEIFPTTVNILRGVPFTFQTTATGGEAVTDVGLRALDDSSCNYFARVKVKAVKMKLSGSTYVQDSEDTADYGSYIELTTTDCNVSKFAGYYYSTGQFEWNSYCIVATGATISASAPPEITDGYLKITLSFEAVQANKEAVKSAFGLTDSDITNLGWTFDATT